MKVWVSCRQDGILRLDAEGGASCSLYLPKSKCARILSIQVPPALRRQGVGGDLLQAVMQETGRLGYQLLECDYLSTEEGLDAFLKKNGFSVASSDQLLTVDLQPMLASAKIQKTLGQKEIGIRVDPVNVLMHFEVRDVVKLYARLAVLELPDDLSVLENFDLDLSFAAYDEDDRLQAMLLVSRYGEEIFVQILFGISNRQPQFVYAVCRKLLQELSSKEQYRNCRKLSMITANPSVKPLLAHFLEQKDLYQETQVCHAEHALEKDAGSSAGPLEERLLEDAFFELRKEQWGCLYQSNINVKSVWRQMAGQMREESR